MHQGLGFGKRGAFIHGDETVLRCHDAAKRRVEALFKA